MEHHHFVQPVHEFRRKLPSRRFHRRPFDFLSSPAAGLSFGWMKPIPPSINSVISPPPRFEVRKITVCDKSTRRLSPRRQRGFVQHAQQQLPQRVRRFLNFVKQQKAQLQLVRMICRQRFLRDQRMSFPVPQIARRRTNQFRNFMRVLEFRAVHFDNRACIAKQNLRSRFHDARLARTRRSQETADCPLAVPASSIPRRTLDTGPPAPEPLPLVRRSSPAKDPSKSRRVVAADGWDQVAV